MTYPNRPARQTAARQAFYRRQRRIESTAGVIGCLAVVTWLMFFLSVTGLAVWAFLHFALGAV